MFFMSKLTVEYIEITILKIARIII